MYIYKMTAYLSWSNNKLLKGAIFVNIRDVVTSISTIIFLSLKTFKIIHHFEKDEMLVFQHLFKPKLSVGVICFRHTKN